MKQKIFLPITTALLFLVISSFTFFSFTTKRMGDEFWKQLGMTENEVKAAVSNSFINGYPNWAPLKKIAVSNRASIVSEIINYAKQYVNSPAFQKEYKQWRDFAFKAKTRELMPALTREQITKKKISNTEADIKTFQDLLKTTADAATKKEWEKMLDFNVKQLAEFKSGKSSQIDYELSQDEMRYQRDKQEYDAWVKDNPETVNELIKTRLNGFLEATKGIDYNAVFVGEVGSGYFKNPHYEGKSDKWKYAFHAGKEITETARTFIQQWLKEIQ